MKIFLLSLSVVAAVALLAAQNDPAPAQPPSSQTELSVTINGENGSPPHYAVPDFIPLSSDPETVAAAKLLGQVLWDDLAFEHEFDLIPRDTYRTIPQARSFSDVPFDRWRELGTDGLVIGTVQRSGTTFHIEMRLYNVRSRQLALG